MRNEQIPRMLLLAACIAAVILASVGVQAPVLSEQAALKPAVIHVNDVLKQGLSQRAGGFSFSVLGETGTGGVELFSLKTVQRHYHPLENHFLYILQGRAKGQIANISAEVGPGDLVVIPAGKDYAHQFQAIGEEPVVFLLFSTPPFHAQDIVWIQ